MFVATGSKNKIKRMLAGILGRFFLFVPTDLIQKPGELAHFNKGINFKPSPGDLVYVDVRKSSAPDNLIQPIMQYPCTVIEVYGESSELKVMATDFNGEHYVSDIDLGAVLMVYRNINIQTQSS